MGIVSHEHWVAVDAASIRVAVVDQRRFIADALAATVAGETAFDVVERAAGPLTPEAVAAAEPDLVLVGAGVDDQVTLELLAGLRTLLPRARIVLVADRLSSRFVGAVVEHGLGGLLLTDYSQEDMLASLRRIAHGQAVMPDGWQAALAGGGAGPLDSLSDRQLDVLHLLAEGHSYEEIGQRLFISVNTVKFHTRSIFERLGVRNRTAAARVLATATLGQAPGWASNHPSG